MLQNGVKRRLTFVKIIEISGMFPQSLHGLELLSSTISLSSWVELLSSAISVSSYDRVIKQHHLSLEGNLIFTIKSYIALREL